MLSSYQYMNQTNDIIFNTLIFEFVILLDKRYDQKKYVFYNSSHLFVYTLRLFHTIIDVLCVDKTVDSILTQRLFYMKRRDTFAKNSYYQSYFLMFFHSNPVNVFYV